VQTKGSRKLNVRVTLSFFRHLKFLPLAMGPGKGMQSPSKENCVRKEPGGDCFSRQAAGEFILNARWRKSVRKCWPPESRSAQLDPMIRNGLCAAPGFLITNFGLDVILAAALYFVSTGRLLCEDASSSGGTPCIRFGFWPSRHWLDF